MLLAPSDVHFAGLGFDTFAWSAENHAKDRELLSGIAAFKFERSFWLSVSNIYIVCDLLKKNSSISIPQAN